MKKSSFLLLFVFCGAMLASAQDFEKQALRKIADEVLMNSTAYENLRYLCKKVGPRIGGSPGAEKAVQATARMLRDAGADTVYLQPCTVPYWVRAAKETGYYMQAGKKNRLRLCALGNSEGSKGKPVTAEVIEVKSLNALHSLGVAVKGKIVFFNIPMNPLHIRTFRAYGESGAGRRSGPAQAAKYGAAGAMVRSLASNIDTFPHTGATQYNDSFPKIPAVAISTFDAEQLSKALANGKVSASFTTDCGMRGTKPSFNVVGVLRGSLYPEQIVTVGGHLDSWDLGEGAHDDGTGCMQSIEVLRALKAAGLRPKRTVRAVMFMSEENSGAGGDEYLEIAKRLNEKHVFALESDAGGFTPRTFQMEMPDEKKAAMLKWKPLFAEYGIYEFNSGGSGSDIEPLKEINVPLAGFGPDSQRYFDLHHASTDVFEAVSKRELDLGAATMAMLVWLVAEYGL